MNQAPRAEGQHPYNVIAPEQQGSSVEGETGMKPGFPSPTALALPSSKSFEQQPRESLKAFAAFRCYLDMGPQRSLALVASKLGKSKVLMERWSRRYDWIGRVAAHAAYTAQVERETIEALARERAIEWMKVHEDQRIQEWKRRSKLLELADRMIARWEANEKKCGTLEGIARLLELASKLGRLASGMETDGIGTEAKEMPTVHVEVSVALEKIYGQPLPGEVVAAPSVVDVSATNIVEETQP